MANLFFISDTHFGHSNILTFSKGAESAEMLRPGFRDVLDMNEFIVENWNKTVRPQDHVYHLGDVAMKRQELAIVRRLNGHKRLIFGNHDIFEYQEYAKVGFEKVMGMRVMEGLVFTHVPIHPMNLGRFKMNVHGHMHDKIVMHPLMNLPDHRYLNVSVEQINYTPISLDEIRKHANN